MAVTLIGEVVNACDAVTGFNAGNISGDDDFVEGTGAIGIKASATTQEMYTTSLGAGAPYDFSSGGPEEGYHIIMWFNTKTPINATAGLRIVVGNGTSRGHWNVDPAGFYKGGFITKVVNTARDFNSIAVGSWSTTGNPAQLNNVTQVGGVFQTTTSIMGSFNNVQLDQITIGLGVRADGGTVGTPNTFETVRAADEDTAFWGWWGSSNGAIVAKGKLYIGPAAGSATSVFNDTAFVVTFADERVATGFYEINTRGAGTDVTWDLAAISAANPTNARWNLTVQADTNSFTDTNGVWKGGDQLSLEANASLDGTTFIDCTRVIQNGASLENITVLDANITSGVAAVESDDPSLIQNSTFNFSGAGHAIEITVAGTYTFTGNFFNGSYSGTGNDAAIWFNPTGGTGNLVLNITGGGNISASLIRNSSSGSVTVNNNVSITVDGLRDNTEVRVYLAGTTTVVDGIESATSGTTNDRFFTFSVAASTAVDIRIFNVDYEVADVLNFSTTVDAVIPVSQRFDRNYSNP